MPTPAWRLSNHNAIPWLLRSTSVSCPNSYKSEYLILYGKFFFRTKYLPRTVLGILLQHKSRKNNKWREEPVNGKTNRSISKGIADGNCPPYRCQWRRWCSRMGRRPWDNGLWPPLNCLPTVFVSLIPVLMFNWYQYFVTESDRKQKFEQWDCLRWTETKRVYTRIKEECSDQFEYFRKIAWCIRPILPHQAYAAIFMIPTEVENHGVLLADQVGSGKVYTVSRWGPRLTEESWRM